MPTVIIHPTQTPDSAIKHDGSWARSWMVGLSTHTDAGVAGPDQQTASNASVIPESAQVSLKCVTVRADDRSGLGDERPHRHRYALTAPAY